MRFLSWRNWQILRILLKTGLENENYLFKSDARDQKFMKYMSCPSIGIKRFWTNPNCFWQVRKWFLSIEFWFLTLSKTTWTKPKIVRPKRRTRHKCITHNGSVFLFRIHNQHAIIKLGEKKDKVVIKPVEKDCRILVNLIYTYIYT